MDEPHLPDDPATMDLGPRVDAAWVDFQAVLADTLDKLPEGAASLAITLDPTAADPGFALYSVTVDLTEPGQLRAYAVSNRMLPREQQIPANRLASIMALGWSAPGVVPGSGQRFGLTLARTESLRAAKIIVRTLREVYGSPHPAYLLYHVLGGDGSALTEPPPLGIAQPVAGEEVAPAQQDIFAVLPLEESIALVLSQMGDIAPGEVVVDPDGTFRIRAGSAMVFVRVREDAPLVQLISPVLTEVPENQRLYQRLGELSHRIPIGRLYFTEGTVWFGVTVFGREFRPNHFMFAVTVIRRLADELDDDLSRDFGGRRFFSDPHDSVPTAPEPPPEEPFPGLYL